MADDLNSSLEPWTHHTERCLDHDCGCVQPSSPGSNLWAQFTLYIWEASSGACREGAGIRDKENGKTEPDT